MANHGDDLGDRMKGYENVSKTQLKTKCPVIIRIDGKTFHTFTKGFNRPFDEILTETMEYTMASLCHEISGCCFAYQQSDEISLLLVDYQNPKTQSWFDYKVQKMCSVGASMATMYFNKFFVECVKCSTYIHSELEFDSDGNVSKQYLEDSKQLVPYYKGIMKGAMFDCRCFNIPKDEVTNYFYWRQADAMRNSVQMIGRAYFSHKELQNKSCFEIKEMLLDKGINCKFYPDRNLRGSCCMKEKCKVQTEHGDIERDRWIVDERIPVFKGIHRNYIDKYVYVGE